ncbi:MAG: hypothetical protein WC182_05575 [Bacilli bacterium]|jgi:hypothetical protein
MKRLVRTFLLLSLITLFFVSCASTATIETDLVNPLKDVTPIETAIEPALPLTVEEEIEPINYVKELATSSSIAKLVPVKRQVSATFANSYVSIYNNTGYKINFLDVFTDAMYEENDMATNLLDTDSLDNGNYWYLDLGIYPDLAKAIEASPEVKIYINALDVDGDLFFKEWYPTVGEFETTLEFSDLDVSSHPNEPETMGDFILFTNQTPYNFDQLYLQEGSEDESPNLLDFELLPGNTVRIDTADISWVKIEEDASFLFVVHDTDGDPYEQEWIPELSSWHIYLTMQDLNFFSDTPVSVGKMPLTFINNTDSNIWYIYMATQEMFDEGDFGYDLLDLDVLGAGDTIKISSVSFPWVIDTLKEEEDPLFSITAYDSEEGMYFRHWKPISENWELTFEDSDFVK